MKTQKLLRITLIFIFTSVMYSCDNNDSYEEQQARFELQAIDKGDVVRPQDRN